RRHTRFSRDWSSDVCSSDLGPRKLSTSTLFSRFTAERGEGDPLLLGCLASRLTDQPDVGLTSVELEALFSSGSPRTRLAIALGRSEERRVGHGSGGCGHDSN